MAVESLLITDRALWLKWRHKTIGASEVPIVCGATTYKTPLRLWAEKTGAVEVGEQTAIMKRGLLLESAVLAYVQDEHPDWVITRPNVWVHDPETKLSCTPDAVAEIPDHDPDDVRTMVKEAVIQCKVIARPIFDRDWAEKGPDGEDVPPPMYTLQTLTEVMLWGADVGYLAVLVIDTFSAELRMFDVPRHPGAEFRILKCVRDFWDDVEAGREPKADYAKDLGLLEQLYPPDMGHDVLDLSSDNRMAELLADRAELKEQIRLNTKDVEIIDAEIVDKLRGAVSAFTGDYKITRKLTHRSEYIVPAKNYPVLRITEKKQP